ncbi:MAG: histidine phosphatase family protein [Bacilli bacterium]|nr:histidine phosphatase family protein [Bacilli bacterium]
MELDIIKTKVAKLAKSKNINIQAAWDIFFFEEFLHRLSLSDYSELFVLKGGFYLQSIVGVNIRSTMDLDLKLMGIERSSEELFNIIKGIVQIKTDSNIMFDILSINDILAESKYGGKTIKISAKFYNVKKVFSIDIGFGDIITPYPINYNYQNSISDNNYSLLSYPIETCIAEKFETIVSKGTNNSRSKDLLDICLYQKQEYNIELLNAAMVNTFFIRNTKYDYDYIFDSLNNVFNSIRIKELYDNYQHKHSFASSITFEMCKEAVYSLLSKLVFKDKINLSDFGVELHVVRHGQDEINKPGGWSDNHLIEEGIQQVNDLLDCIDDDYDLFVSSDLNRAKETAEILNSKMKINVVYDRKFREVNNGDLKNLTKEDFINKYSGLYYSSLKMDESYPNGESPNMFYERISNSFVELLKSNKNKKILLVTHGGVITVILCLLNGYVYNNNLKINPKTGSIIKLK